MQYSRDESGNLTPLPKPSIDTGMGLERISAVLQGKLNNFDTDLFMPLISAITATANTTYGKSAETDTSIRVIADHIRAISFSFLRDLCPQTKEGVMSSEELLEGRQGTQSFSASANQCFITC